MIKQKVIITIISFLILILPSTFAQISIKGGIAISDIVFIVEGQSPYLGYEVNYLTHRLPYLTYQGGVFKTYSLSNRLEFQPELLFVKKGLNYSMKFLYDNVTYIIKIHYLEVPLLLKYSLFSKRKNQFAILAGPYTSYMINTVRIREIDGKKNKDKMSNISKVDVGFAAGLSYDFSLHQDRFNIDLRTTYSIINMMDYIEGFVPRYYGPDEERARNVNIALTLGYMFKSSKSK